MHNYDPRSKLYNKDGSRRVDQHGDIIKTPAERKAAISAAERKAFTVPNSVIVCEIMESSSFSGQKFDGYAYLPNAESLTKFRQHIKSCGSRDEYSFIHRTMLMTITDQGLRVLIDAIKANEGRPWLWCDADYCVATWQSE